MLEHNPALTPASQPPQQPTEPASKQTEAKTTISISSNLMIVNSQPYSPSEQRCIGLTQTQQATRQQDTHTMLGGHQQNSLYGLPGFEQQQQATGDSPDLLDLAHLQHGGPLEPASQQNPAAMQFNTRQQHHELTNATTRHHNDVSLYSPSSSTSLLYHIYDQINVPAELQKQSHLHPSNEQHQRKLNNTTTILNPANLFGGQPLQQQQHALPLKGPMSMYQQQQQQQQCYGSSAQYLMAGNHQQPLFHQNNAPNTMHHSQSSYQSSVALETALRQHHHATLARSQPRPLSSSAASSISAQSASLSAYGHRQIANGLRLPVGSKQTINGHLPSLIHTGARSHLPLQHHHLTTGGPRMGSSGAGPANLGGSGGKLGVAGSAASSIEAKWKQCSLGMRHMVHEYRVPLRYSILLILLAFSFMSIIKFTLMSAPSANTNPEQQVSPSLATPFSHHLFPALSSNPSSSNTFYPQLASGGFAKTIAEPNAWLPEPSDLEEQQKSKLVTGEFVIINQNYSHSQMHRSFLGQQIVQLMDQVFLGSEMRRVYLKMEITDVRPAKPAGITVSCNIVLRESIPVAAQQFGVALYNSLTKTQERLANHNYIIDRSSIKFNTVPDKDLRSGVLPPSLLSHFLSTSSDGLEAPSGGFSTSQQTGTLDPVTLDGATSSSGDIHEMIEPPAGVSSQDPLLVNGGSSTDDMALLDPQEAVVWSEWSPWSSCVDKNGLCDSGRLHSRLRRCINQTNAQVVEASLCKQRFNSDDRNIEVEDCSRTCGGQAWASSSADTNPVMSDAPSSGGGPQTAPPLFGPTLNEGPASFFRLAALTSTEAARLVNHTLDPLASFSSTLGGEELAGSGPTLSPLKTTDQQQLSCSNCTTDEICLLLVQQKVPFCAKIKERTDESGCGGWCKSPGHLCQPVGQNAFKCVHDSECLAEEWRCHDSACIPSTNRCDGHPNCFDSSDELDCPA